MKRAYLVLGPESSGTRLLTRILMAVGCRGNDGHDQRWDDQMPTREPLVVWRRSAPHGKRWPCLVTMVTLLQASGYDVQAVVTTRDWHATVQSQVAQGHVQTPQAALGNLRRAYPHIFGGLSECDVPYVVVSYESLVQRPRAVIRRLVTCLGLAGAPEVEIYDGNAQYYEGGG